MIKRVFESVWSAISAGHLYPSPSVRSVGAILTKGAYMTKPIKTAKHKLNSAHVHGVLVIAGFLGLVTGSWLIFALAAGALVFTSIQDGSIRL